MKSKFLKPEKHPDLDPVSFFNAYKIDYIFELFEKKGIRKISENKFDGIIYENNIFASNGNEQLDEGLKYTPFMVLTKIEFKGNSRAAFEFINYKLRENEINYMRVGASYFKKIIQVDRFGIERAEVKPWKKEEIVQDHGKKIIDYVPRFDNFIIEPNNLIHEDIVGQSYNLYSKFSHTPKEGSIEWSLVILEHIFGEQIELGLKYLKVLYEHPRQILPILVLVSKTRQTGKTTFLNWLNQIFGANMVVINPEDIMSQFNSSYAKANIIAIEETVSDKSATVEKLKALSTQKFVNMNQKFVDNYKLPFFGKFIITTNDENKFMKVDEEEIRFWVRNIPPPKIQCSDIEDKLICEIPAFLHHLKTLAQIDFSKSRMIFTVAELNTHGLERVKEESKPQLYKDMCIYFEDWFLNNQNKEDCFFTLKQIKEVYFSHNSQISPSYIKSVLRDHFKLSASEKSEYKESIVGQSPVIGKFYCINRSLFGDTREVVDGVGVAGEWAVDNNELPY